MSEQKALHCDECGVDFDTGFFPSPEKERVSLSNRAVCGACYLNIINAGTLPDGVEEELPDGVEEDETLKTLRAKAKTIPITTGFTTAAGPITEEIDVITSECVYGINLFKDMFGGIRDIVGGRAGAHQKVLKDLRQTCLNELRMNAAEIGADAVIGIDLDYSEVSGMLMLVASGTAVQLGPKEAPING